MQINDLKELISALNDSTIQQFEMENNEVKLKISKCKITGVVETTTQETHSPERSVDEKLKVNKEVSKVVAADDSVITVMSPMVGVYYEAPSTDSEPFISVGKVVQEGESLCIIEAMKIMNEISAEFKGEILEILVENEDVVEYGQPLMTIRRL